MTRKRALVWWIYIVSLIVVVLFVVPTMLSASDTGMVLSAIGLLVLIGVLSWNLWVRQSVQQGASRVPHNTTDFIEPHGPHLPRE